MARKTKEEAEKTRRRLLDAAFEVFTRKGFSRTTLGEVAAAAGVTRGAVYWHFKNKVDLFMALAEETAASAAVRPRDMPVDEVGSLEDLKREILAYLEHFEKNTRYAVFYELIHYRTEYTEELAPALVKHRDDQREALERLGAMFGRLRRLDRVRRDLEPRRAALMLAALVVGITELWLRDRAAFSLSEIVPELLDDFFRSFSPRRA